MLNSRRLPPYWRRTTPIATYDIARLRPATLASGKRFETPSDARKESRRSEAALTAYRPDCQYGTYLHECRKGDYNCEKTYCPKCARTFRRHITSELLRLNSEFDGRIRILVILLESSPKRKLLKLDIARYHHLLRKRLERTGLTGVPIIGGFEMIYRARTKEWVLHANLVVFGGSTAEIRKFANGFPGERSVRRDDFNDAGVQLSYALKFTTYHRPHEQRGAKKAKAVPLNPSEHYELVRWMAQYEFSDHLFLFNARRRGASIELSSKAARKA
jgi:hypothetical protein